MKKHLLLCPVVMLAAFAVCGQPVEAQAAVTIDGTSVTMIMTEPALNADGTPLADLFETVGFYQVGNGPQTVCGRAPASRPSGGNDVQVTCVVPIAQNQEADVRFRAQAFDTTGNPSVMSADVIRRIDHLPPAAPGL